MKQTKLTALVIAAGALVYRYEFSKPAITHYIGADEYSQQQQLALFIPLGIAAYLFLK